jgi:hypothetical protein
MNAKDLTKPGVVVLGIAVAAALGFAAGYMVGRDPQLLRRLARSLAGGAERLGGAVAEWREELADLWAEARAGAREDAEAQAFAAAAAAAAAASESAAAAAEETPQPKAASRRASSRGAKRRSATARARRRAAVDAAESS